MLNCIRQREVVDLSAKPLALVRGRDRKLAERPGVRLAKKGNRRVEFWTPESHCSDKFSQKFGNEAMACGCIPIVSNIPSFKKMTDEGKCGFLFTPGDAEGLYRVLMKLPTIDNASFIKKVIDKFNKDLSFQAIASGIEKEIKS